jgi:hypothetical protein
VACWECDTMSLPFGWSAWRFWQVGQFVFSGGARIDGNAYAADANALRLELSRDMTLDDGAAWATTRSVVADLLGYDGKAVRYATGDGAWGPWLPYRGRFALNLGGKQGTQEVRLQLRSFRNIKSPTLRESIGLDSKPPTVFGPKIGIRPGQQVPKDAAHVPTRVQVSAQDATSGMRSSGLKVTCGNTKIASQYREASRTRLKVDIGRRGCTVLGRADDVAGHRSSQLLKPRIRLRDARRGLKHISLSGDWKVLTRKSAVAKTLARTRSAGASAKLKFDGAQFAVVAQRGPTGGRFKVILDGKRVDTVNLYSEKRDVRRIVYVRNVSKGKHKVQLKTTGTKSKRSSGTTVWLDAVLVLDERK